MAETRNPQAQGGPATAASVDEWFRAADKAAEAKDGPKPYRYRRDESWDPASVAPMQAPRRRAPERLEEFIRLREVEGLRIGEAATRLGLAHQTGSKYEALRKARHADGNSGGAQ